jgi:hypothetical protein
MDIDETRFIYRASIRLRNGVRIFACQYGLKAFRIKVATDNPDQRRLPGL